MLHLILNFKNLYKIILNWRNLNWVSAGKEIVYVRKKFIGNLFEQKIAIQILYGE
jgi:hypothetical protein